MKLARLPKHWYLNIMNRKPLLHNMYEYLICKWTVATQTFWLTKLLHLDYQVYYESREHSHRKGVNEHRDKHDCECGPSMFWQPKALLFIHWSIIYFYWLSAVRWLSQALMRLGLSGNDMYQPDESWSIQFVRQSPRKGIQVLFIGHIVIF